MKSTLLFLVFLFSFTNLRAQNILPILIDSKIAELRSASVAVRFEYYSLILNQFKSPQNTETLKNLLDFGKHAFELSKAIDTDDWMINAAAQIANRASEKLLLQRPADHQLLTDYYQGFIGDSQATSFSVLTFWMNLVKSNAVGSETELTEIIQFAKNARTVSTSLNHENYVTNLASQIITLASTQVLKINPFVEGIFKLEAKCDSPESACIPPRIATILVTDDQKGITVSFSRPEGLASDFYFDSAELSEGDTLKSSPNSFLNEGNLFVLKFDKNAGTFTGLIQSSRLLGDIRIKGTKIFGNDLLFKGPFSNKPKMEQIKGSLKGQLILQSNPKFPVIFNIRQLDNHLVASLRGENLFLEFASGYYIAEKGILTFISNKNGKIIKLTFSVAEDSAGKILMTGTGIALSTATHWQIELTQ